MKYSCRLWIFACIAAITFSHPATISSQDKPAAQSSEAAREKLLLLFSGEWVARGLYVASKLEIADLLQSGPKTTEELANLTSANPESLQRLLHMLAGLGIFEELSPGFFANSDASLLLVKTNPETLHSLSIFYGEELHKPWDEVLASIQTGTPAFQLTYNQPVFAYFKENPARAALFQDAMKEKSKAVIKSALSTYDFSKFNTIYDIGGGYGQFMQALLQKYPHLSGMIFELPEVVAKIRQQNPQLENSRCQLAAGDFFDFIPGGGDAYLLKSVIHDWDDPKAEKILKNCHQAMRPDSRLLIVDIVLQPGSQSVYANCMDFIMLMITGGKERNLSDFTQMLENCGFVLEKIYPTSTEFSIIEARKK